MIRKCTAAADKRSMMEQLFGTIAQRYDRFNTCASLALDRLWRARAIREALHDAPQDRVDVLDVCAGTGALTVGCAERVNGRSLVVGLDVSEPMLRLACQKARQHQARVTWLRGDAHRLPFPDASFHVVTIGFATRNVPDVRQACGEMLRVLRPHGRLIILEAGKPQRWPVRIIYYTYVTCMMPLIGLIICGRLWPFRYLRRSILAFLQPQELVQLLREIGGTSVTHHPLHGGLADLFVAMKGA